MGLFTSKKTHQKRVDQFINILKNHEEKQEELTEDFIDDVKKSFKALGKEKQEVDAMINAINTLRHKQDYIKDLTDKARKAAARNDTKEFDKLIKEVESEEKKDEENFNALGKQFFGTVKKEEEYLKWAENEIINLFKDPYFTKPLRMQVHKETSGILDGHRSFND